MKTGMQLIKAHPASSACSAYQRVAALRAYGQIGDQDLGLRFAKGGSNVNHVVGRLRNLVLQVTAQPVTRWSSSDRHAEMRYGREVHSIVWQRLRLPPRDPDLPYSD